MNAPVLASRSVQFQEGAAPLQTVVHVAQRSEILGVLPLSRAIALVLSAPAATLGGKQVLVLGGLGVLSLLCKEAYLLAVLGLALVWLANYGKAGLGWGSPWFYLGLILFLAGGLVAARVLRRSGRSHAVLLCLPAILYTTYWLVPLAEPFVLYRL